MNLLQTMNPVAATGLFSYAWLMIAIPLAVAGLLLVLGKLADAWGHLLGVLAPIASFVIALLLFISMMGSDEASRSVRVPVYTWVSAGAFSIDISMLVDQLSILFALLVTFVGSLIFIYSIGYMKEDPKRRRFFAFLNFFVASMMTLVLADNYIMLFIGWEGVGLASYLLIGFWQERNSAALAAKKAFVTNKVGDLGLFAASFAMFSLFGSVRFDVVSNSVANVSPAWATALGCLLLLAACGKSAQVPLQVWLLDAMEGPTPVSALIHAATMVTAGVYLVVRSHAIYALSNSASLAVAIVGLASVFAGAWIGCAKDDIKKVLAGSTMSQIGYMMLAAGLGPAGAAFAIFHLLTHGAFKANMFLGAGAVMHGMNEDTNMHHFGALAKAMPWVFGTFACGYLAIIGFPFFAGFYSKDHIIVAAFDKGPIFGWLALIGAGITAFYMTRLMMMTFMGNKRWLPGVHPHKPGALMVVPLVILAIISVVGGLALNGWIQGWLEPAVANEIKPVHVFDTGWISLVTLLAVALGVVIGVVLYRSNIAQETPVSHNFFVLAGRNELYANQFNEAVLMRPGQALCNGLELTDNHLVDGTVRSSAAVVTGASGALRLLQNGYVRTYGVTMALGLVVIGVVMILGQLA
ncbi:NADH dehydrogenase subunit L [Propionibacterium freudenreichii]|uniref:NADH dehydrogenase subunit L n=3 Tax=Propionibacteriaceae TaxID=31957 RepID=A0A2C8A1X3_9ACTN|nr:NADH dehydrogenase subunit I L nuoL [Propionibacterium freudenreichii subsp. freudenreichii]CEG89782.1 NADH dehydrogenase (quinone) [Propionibacterium freudenreichii]CUW20970.1 NADH dehydrogenase subunit L NuoL [Propionibacterium freudenreichii subsp. shermanii]CEI26719.1 NADH dehydrogenase (quinone) [Propionibacterium freudenreichii]CEI32814.1 NADH dehydrogenase (quinone) [Propionibacterium freudenreichii]